MSVVTLGPLLIAADRLVWFAAFGLAVLVGTTLAQRRRARLVDRLFALAFVGLVAARLVFVARHAALYAPHPLQILDIRDQGFDLWGGLAAVALYALIAGWRVPALRVPLAGALAAGALGASLGLWGLAVLDTQPTHLSTIPLARANQADTSLAGLAETAPDKPMVVNLWASWCGPCRREMPMLARAQTQYPGVVFVFVNEDDTRDAMQRFLADTGLRLEHQLIDTQHRLAQARAVRGYPTTLFFDADGEHRARHTGVLSPAMLAERLRGLTDSAPD
ncbi:MAG: redoxin [Xanthomonadales bacterium]|nr:redoxin [Xanthomonadales bacterium]